MTTILRDNRAYSMMFLGMIFVPLMALTFDVGCYLYAARRSAKRLTLTLPHRRSTGAPSVKAARCTSPAKRALSPKATLP